MSRAFRNALPGRGSMDFVADRLGDGRQFRLLNALDNFNRGGLGSKLISRYLPNASSAALIESSNGAANPGTIRVPSRDHAKHNPAGQRTMAPNTSAKS